MYKQGDIVLVNIPFSNLTSNKKRPVVVISNNEYNNLTDDIVVVAVTSNITEKEYGVIIKNIDMEEGNLKVDSQIRTDKIYTLSKSIVIKKYGSIKRNIFNEIKTKIDKLIKSTQ